MIARTMNEQTTAVCVCGHAESDHPWLPVQTFDPDRPCEECRDPFKCFDYQAARASERPKETR